MLTEQRVALLLQQMYPFLARDEYETAIEGAIDGIMFYSAVGEPHFWEDLSENHYLSSYTTIIWLTAAIAFASYTFRQQHKQEEHSSPGIMSHQDELDRVHAELLNNRYKTDTCPICLESFLDGEWSDRRRKVGPSNISDVAILTVRRVGAPGKPKLNESALHLYGAGFAAKANSIPAEHRST